MGRGVDDGVGNIILRQVWIVWFAIERKLKYVIAGQIELIQESFHVGCNRAEIFCDERPPTQSFLNSNKEIGTGTFYPQASSGTSLLRQPVTDL